MQPLEGVVMVTCGGSSCVFSYLLSCHKTTLTHDPNVVIGGSNFQVLGNQSQVQITTVKLDGSNYLTWSKSMLIYIKRKDREDYLIGEVEIPP